MVVKLHLLLELELRVLIDFVGGIVCGICLKFLCNKAKSRSFLLTHVIFETIYCVIIIFTHLMPLELQQIISNKKYVIRRRQQKRQRFRFIKKILLGTGWHPENGSPVYKY